MLAVIGGGIAVVLGVDVSRPGLFYLLPSVSGYSRANTLKDVFTTDPKRRMVPLEQKKRDMGPLSVRKKQVHAISAHFHDDDRALLVAYLDSRELYYHISPHCCIFLTIPNLI